MHPIKNSTKEEVYVVILNMPLSPIIINKFVIFSGSTGVKTQYLGFFFTSNARCINT